MKIENLGTIVGALAKEDKDGSTEALKEVLNQNNSIIKDNYIYEVMGPILANSIKLKENEEDNITAESERKLEFLNEILPFIKKNFNQIIKTLLEYNVELTNIFLMKLANNKNYQEKVKKYLIKDFATFLDNNQMVNLTIDFPEFNPNIVENMAKKLKKLENDSKDMVVTKEFETEKENYFLVILKLLNTGNVTKINTSLIENIFSLSSDYKTDLSILHLLQEYLKDDEISLGVNKAKIFDYLVAEENYLILEEWISNEKFFSKEKAEDSLSHVFKKMEKFNVLVHHFLEENEKYGNWTSLFLDLVTDIDGNSLLLKCYTNDIIDVLKLYKAIRNVNDDNEINIQMDKLINKSKSLEVTMPYYYEKMLFCLMESKCFTPCVKKLLKEHDLNLSYEPVHIYGPQPLYYWLASSDNIDLLSTFLTIENLPKVFYGSGVSITLSSIYFKVGEIEKGLEEFQKLDLFKEKEKTYLQKYERFDVDYEERFAYQDRLTQIINSILLMEGIDEQTKKNLISTILLDKKVEFVNLDLFEQLYDLFSNEELNTLYNLLQDRTFISYRTNEVDYHIYAVEVSTEDEIKEKIWLFIDEKISLKRDLN